jgi:hypothetical protein
MGPQHITTTMSTMLRTLAVAQRIRDSAARRGDTALVDYQEVLIVKLNEYIRRIYAISKHDQQPVHVRR